MALVPNLQAANLRIAARQFLEDAAGAAHQAMIAFCRQTNQSIPKVAAVTYRHGLLTAPPNETASGSGLALGSCAHLEPGVYAIELADGLFDPAEGHGPPTAKDASYWEKLRDTCGHEFAHCCRAWTGNAELDEGAAFLNVVAWLKSQMPPVSMTAEAKSAPIPSRLPPATDAFDSPEVEAQFALVRKALLKQHPHLRFGAAIRSDADGGAGILTASDLAEIAKLDLNPSEYAALQQLGFDVSADPDFETRYHEPMPDLDLRIFLQGQAQAAAARQRSLKAISKAQRALAVANEALHPDKDANDYARARRDAAAFMQRVERGQTTFQERMSYRPGQPFEEG